MNEKTNEGAMLYDSNEAVKNLNKVEGFEPKGYLRKEATEDGYSYYLDTKYRLLWFRLMYPQGKIVKLPKAIGKDYATFEARIYADIHDKSDDFLANGFASRYKDETNKQFGMSFVESAETAALGRALKDAGFGTQFCDIALPNDGQVVDAGVNLKLSDNLTEDGIITNDIQDIDMSTGEILESGAETATVGTTPASPASVTGTVADAANITAPPPPQKVVLTPNMSIDELKAKMSIEYAKNVQVAFGYDKGKTLGEIILKRPDGIKYHTNHGDNMVQAAAQVLLEAAQRKVS